MKIDKWINEVISHVSQANNMSLYLPYISSLSLNKSDQPHCKIEYANLGRMNKTQFPYQNKSFAKKLISILALGKKTRLIFINGNLNQLTYILCTNENNMDSDNYKQFEQVFK